MSKTKPNPKILEAAIELSKLFGYRNITREQVAKGAGVATGTVSLHMGTMKQMRRSIVRHAIRTQHQRIISQAILNDDPLVRKLPVDVRKTALMSIA